MATITVNNSNFDTEVLGASEPVVVDFWAEWCGPCKMIAPALEELSGELDGKVRVAKVNIDENPEIATKYGIRSIPTLYMFKNGEVVDRMVGAAPKGKLADWMNAAAA